jgi:hypothetical protein
VGFQVSDWDHTSHVQSCDSSGEIPFWLTCFPPQHLIGPGVQETPFHIIHEEANFYTREMHTAFALLRSKRNHPASGNMYTTMWFVHF